MAFPEREMDFDQEIVNKYGREAIQGKLYTEKELSTQIEEFRSLPGGRNIKSTEEIVKEANDGAVIQKN